MTLWNLVNPGYGPIALNEGVGSPASIVPGLTMWFDPSRADKVTLNGGDVSQVDDLSGQARHASQGTAGQQPLYATGGSGINGRSVVAFTGANNDALSIASSLGLIRNKPGATFVGVARIPTLGSNQRLLTVLSGVATMFAVQVATGGQLNITSRRLATDSASGGTSTAVVTAATAHFLAVSVTYSNADHLIVIDGTTRNVTAAWTPGAASEDADHSAPVLGRSGANLLTGDEAEMCFWPFALTAAQIETLRTSYFKPKWGTP